jgi:hypothetical protein
MMTFAAMRSNARRARAKAEGRKFYTGEACKKPHCGCTTRYVSTGNCVPCAKAMAVAYNKWASVHKVAAAVS